MGAIVWLASYPKSGNTWVRAFLHNYILQPAAPHGINALNALSVSECHAAFFRRYDPRPASAYSEADVQRMRPLVQRDLTALHEDLVFVKTHNAAVAMHGVPLCGDEVSAGTVYLVRDPRDVAVSYSAYLGKTVDGVIDFMGRAGAANRGTEAQVFEFLGSWSHHALSWAGRPKTLLVRYEDLSATPAASFARIIGFLGAGVAEPERLRRAIGFSDFATLARQEGEDGYAAGGPGAGPFFRKGTVGQWRDVLTQTQVRRIERDHGAVMRRFGYL